MKIGMIFECGRNGPDKQVCEALARRLVPGVQIVPATLGNKPNLVSECGGTAAQMIASGCKRIVVVWDLYPPWRAHRERPCRKEDCEAIRQALIDEGVDPSRVHLVCLEHMLEAWLLADGRAISTVLSRTTRAVSIPDLRNPHRVANPKKRLNRIFQEHGHRPYEAHVHAAQIVSALPDLNRLLSVPTFARFEARLRGGIG